MQYTLGERESLPTYLAVPLFIVADSHQIFLQWHHGWVRCIDPITVIYLICNHDDLIWIGALYLQLYHNRYILYTTMSWLNLYPQDAPASPQIGLTKTVTKSQHTPTEETDMQAMVILRRWNARLPHCSTCHSRHHITRNRLLSSCTTRTAIISCRCRSHILRWYGL